eukprot:gene9451-8461_t
MQQNDFKPSAEFIRSLTTPGYPSNPTRRGLGISSADGSCEIDGTEVMILDFDFPVARAELTLSWFFEHEGGAHERASFRICAEDGSCEFVLAVPAVVSDFGADDSASGLRRVPLPPPGFNKPVKSIEIWPSLGAANGGQGGQPAIPGTALGEFFRSSFRLFSVEFECGAPPSPDPPTDPCTDLPEPMLKAEFFALPYGTLDRCAEDEVSGDPHDHLTAAEGADGPKCVATDLSDLSGISPRELCSDPAFSAGASVVARFTAVFSIDEPTPWQFAVGGQSACGGFVYLHLGRSSTTVEVARWRPVGQDHSLAWTAGDWATASGFTLPPLPP